MNNATVVLAGATGDLGARIAHSLLERGAKVRVIVRPASAPDKVEALGRQGAEIAEADFNSVPELVKACTGGSCVVSALSGLHDVIVETQTRLLEAAIEAGVPRFIPSDYSIDYTKLPYGTNRNLDLRRKFCERLDAAPIAATSVLNGMFTDLLTGQAPVVLFALNRVVYWGNADQPLDFTTTADTAAFTAAAALDPTTPRFLRVAGEVATIRGVQAAAGAATGKKFRLFRAGGLGVLATMIKVTRTVVPKSDDVFPPWQGMQYLHNMFGGLAKLEPLDNSRYPELRWASVQDVLAAR